MSELQNLLYASNRYAALLIFQAMDAAGKDSAIKHVMSGINPQGCQVFSFKHPSLEELDHDFLWRTTQCLPERGRIGIFNRSYYALSLPSQPSFHVRLPPLCTQVHRKPRHVIVQNILPGFARPQLQSSSKFWDLSYRSLGALHESRIPLMIYNSE